MSHSDRHPAASSATPTAEDLRLLASRERSAHWKRWGPYLAERQWGTVREDYSSGGDTWGYFPHDHARSRAYRWGEDGLLGICDRQCRLCFALALWNERDPILKERLFGLTGPEGNHGEDVKECYYYLDAVPTHSYLKALYKYPQAEYPYARLVEESRRRGKRDKEFELKDTGIFDGNRYFDVFAEYAKASPNDVLIRLTVANRGPDAARLHLLPTLWFRNAWSWGCTHDGCYRKPRLEQIATDQVHALHATLGAYRWIVGPAPDGKIPALLFTDNETNMERVFGFPNGHAKTKDAFHEYVIRGDTKAVDARQAGTKVAAHYVLNIPAGGQVTIPLRLVEASEQPERAFGSGFDGTFAERIREADEFYAARESRTLTDEQRAVSRQAYAGLLWSTQFYHYVVKDWLAGDPEMPAPPPERRRGRNNDWSHLFNRDLITMPDKWEYPWYAAWDLAFHMIPLARIDGDFAKEQLVLFLREWYMHPNGQIPAYEFAFGDVNPPVHAWACWRVYKMTGPRGRRDRLFLDRVFKKLLINFTWWVNRKDVHGKHLFSGGFLGLDNIGVFDRSQALPTGAHLEQADGTAWMGFYCTTMLAMALELAAEDPSYEDIASKFFEHFVAIADAMNFLGGTGLWDEQDGFYYDLLHAEGATLPLRLRTMIGIIPLFAAEVLEDDVIDRLPGFRKRMNWFLANRQDMARNITCCTDAVAGRHRRLLAIPSRERLERALKYIFDEREFLSPHGIRSLSRVHKDRPFVLRTAGQEQSVDYQPGESTSNMFGGNSNWRGPVWFPLNYLLIEGLQRYHYFYGDELKVEYPTGSGRRLNLQQVSRDLAARLTSLFLPDAAGRRPCHGDDARYAQVPHWRDLVLFYEHFHGDNGRGLGASHQTGWTALVAKLLEEAARA